MLCVLQVIDEQRNGKDLLILGKKWFSLIKIKIIKLNKFNKNMFRKWLYIIKKSDEYDLKWQLFFSLKIYIILGL